MTVQVMAAKIEALETSVKVLNAFKQQQTSGGRDIDAMTPTKDCKSIGLSKGEDGIYYIKPSGASAKFKVYCLSLPQGNSDKPEWTVIASQPGAHPLQNWASTYNDPAPTPLQRGSVKYFWQTDLTQFAADVFVQNARGDTHIFTTSDFGNNEVKLDDTNFVASISHMVASLPFHITHDSIAPLSHQNGCQHPITQSRRTRGGWVQHTSRIHNPEV